MTHTLFGIERCIVARQVEPLGAPHIKNEEGDNRSDKCEELKDCPREDNEDARAMSKGQQPLTRYGKYIIRATHLFPYL